MVFGDSPPRLRIITSVRFSDVTVMFRILGHANKHR